MRQLQAADKTNRNRRKRELIRQVMDEKKSARELQGVAAASQPLPKSGQSTRKATRAASRPETSGKRRATNVPSAISKNGQRSPLGKKPHAATSIAKSPPQTVMAIPRTVRRNAKDNEMPPVIEVPNGLAGVKHGRKHQKGKRWVITTKAGIKLASFDTETKADAWWSAFQRQQRRNPLPLKLDKVIQSPTKQTRRPKKSNKRASRWSRLAEKAKVELQEVDRQLQRSRGGKAVWKNRTSQKVSPTVFRSTGKATAEYLQPMSAKYDMPEYDLW